MNRQEEYVKATKLEELKLFLFADYVTLYVENPKDANTKNKLLELTNKFNKGTGWVILTFFFGFITIPLLGYAKKNVYTDIEVSKHSLFGSIGK